MWGLFKFLWHSKDIWTLTKATEGNPPDGKLVKPNSVQCWILTDDVAFHMLQSRKEGFLLHLSHYSSFLSEQKVVQTLHNWDQIVYEVDNFFIDMRFIEIFVCRISVLDLVIHIMFGKEKNKHNVHFISRLPFKIFSTLIKPNNCC